MTTPHARLKHLLQHVDDRTPTPSAYIESHYVGRVRTDLETDLRVECIGVLESQVDHSLDCTEEMVNSNLHPSITLEDVLVIRVGASAYAIAYKDVKVVKLEKVTSAEVEAERGTLIKSALKKLTPSERRALGQPFDAK